MALLVGLAGMRRDGVEFAQLDDMQKRIYRRAGTEMMVDGTSAGVARGPGDLDHSLSDIQRVGGALPLSSLESNSTETLQKVSGCTYPAVS